MSSTNQRAGYGVKSLVDLADMEKAQPLSDHPLAIDAVRVRFYILLFESTIHTIEK